MTRFSNRAGHGRIRSFSGDERGSMTVLGLFLLIVFIALGGIAVDFANAMRVRTHLQVASDSAAHAALMARQTTGEADAIAEGIAMAHATMPESVNGDYILASDFAFGTWDRATRTFTPVSGSAEAVRVNTARIAARANPLRTFMLRIIGFEEWDVSRQTVYERYVPKCLTEGFMSEVLVDVTSNNIFEEGYCVHSNSVVEMNNNNLFEPGTMVSMPDLTNLSIPSSGMDSNDGLAEALRVGYYDIGVTERIAAMHALVPTAGTYLTPSYITDFSELSLPRNDTIEANWVEGRIHRVDCPSQNNQVRVRNGSVLRNGVLITNCRLNFGQGVVLEDVVVLSTNTGADAISGASGVQLGANDDCGPNGGVQIATMGGANFPASLSLFGARIIAEHSVSFAAQANSVRGASILSNGPIRGTANGLAGLCPPEGMPVAVGRPYFRLAS